MVQQKKQDLQNEVIQLEAQLKGEETLNRVLRCAIDCPLLMSLPYFSSFPPGVRVLLEELATVEEEILLLERKVKELKLQLYTEKHQSREREHHLITLSERSQCPSRSGYESTTNEHRYRSPNFQIFAKRRITRDRRVSLGSALDFHSLFTTSRRSNDSDCLARHVGPYKDFIHITSSSLHMDRFSQCLPAFGKLRVLINKLCEVDLNLLTNNQKLAFWINIHNACIMNAFLDEGLPTTQDELLALMNKAAMNVGGIVLNAVAIEQLMLRQKDEDEKERAVREAYGVGYPEANVTFGLCRGTWWSPAVRVYRGEEVGRELERAKAEYLEAAVGVRRSKSKRKMIVIVPKVLERQMHDFADDMGSLLEWIYSQLPPSSSLKPPLLQCLSSPSLRIQIQPSPSLTLFRYLIPPSLSP